MKYVKTYENFIAESEEMVNEMESLTATVLLLQAAAVAGQFILLGNKLGYYPIDDLKNWWNEIKRDRAVNSILSKLKDDPEVIDFLNLPPNQQAGKWKKLIEPKLSADDLKYINSISRDRVKNGKIVKSVKESDEVLDEATLEIKGHAYNIWNDKQVQKELKDINIKIIGQMNGVMTISGDASEIEKVKAIFGIK